MAEARRACGEGLRGKAGPTMGVCSLGLQTSDFIIKKTGL